MRAAANSEAQAADQTYRSMNGDRVAPVLPSVRPRGLEPLTFAAAVRRSNPLSYGRMRTVSKPPGLADAQASFHRSPGGNSWRRDGDSNPEALSGVPVFETGSLPFGHPSEDVW